MTVKSVGIVEAKNLQVHHRQYHWSRRLNGHIFPWAYKNQYLITLCDRCHYYGHKKYTVQTFKKLNEIR